MSAYDQNSSDFRIFAETRDGKRFISPVVFKKITNRKAKTWPRSRPMNVEDIEDKLGGKT